MTKAKSLKAAEFAAICGISKDTLLYYDKIDLLKPWRRDDNGTRHYHWDQINTFQIISFLKNSGCSLSEIKDFLSSDSPASYIPMLENNYIKLQHQISEIQKSIDILKLLSFVLGLSEERQAFVEMKDPPALFITKVHEDESPQSALMRHVKALRFRNDIDKYPMGIILGKDSILNGESEPRAFYNVCSGESEGAVPGEQGIRFRDVISAPSSEIFTLIRHRIENLISTGHIVGEDIKCDILIGEPNADNTGNVVIEAYIPIYDNLDKLDPMTQAKYSMTGFTKGQNR